MKKILLLLLLSPLLSIAQNSLPRFDNDTIYTTSGYNIYKGQILHLASGTSEAGYFRFISFHSTMVRTDTYILQNSSIKVNKIKSYKSSGLGSSNMRLFGTATLKDGRQLEVDIVMDSEKAIEGLAGQTPELTVPEEFKNKRVVAVKEEVKKQETPGDLKKILIADEIKKLFDLYKQGALSKEEYEAQKKKLLERQ